MKPLKPFQDFSTPYFTIRPKKSTKLMINTKIYKPKST